MRFENPFAIGFTATLGVLTALTLGGMIGSLGTIITYVGVALFLALGFEPIIGWLERHGWPRWLAMTSSLALVFGVLGLIVWAIVPSIAAQTTQLTERYNAIVQGVLDLNLVEWLNATFPELNLDDALNDGIAWLRDNVGTIGGGVLQFGAGVLSGLTGTLIVFILTLYFVASMNAMKRGFYQLAPASKRARFSELTEKITRGVGKYVIGQISLALVNGILSFVFLTIVGAAMPAVCAVIAFLGSLIPLVGTLSGSVIIVLAQLVLLDPGGSTWWVVAVYYAVYMQIEAYVLSPRIMSQAVSVPGPIVVIAALTGGTLLGLLGALIAIPVAAAVLTIINEVVIPKQNER